MRQTMELAWISAMALAVFVVWLAADVSANAGVGCSALYVIGDAIQPVPNFEVALALRLLVFVGVVVLVSSVRAGGARPLAAA